MEGMTPHEIRQLQEEMEQYLPTSLQVKLNELIETKVPATASPNQLIEGLILTEVKTNSWGQIIFSGFCSQIKGDAADFIQNTWQSNWGHCKEYSIK